MAAKLGSGKRRRGRRWLGALAGVSVATAGLWVAVHEVPWLGPMLAEGARAIVGPGPVAAAEDVAYGVADRIKLLVSGDAAPKTYWEPPPEVAADGDEAPETAPARVADTAAKSAPGERPPAAKPPFDAVAAAGDGVWIDVNPPGAKAPPAMWKTLIHPDPKRPFAAVAVVAIDLGKVALHAVPGTEEPKAPHVAAAERPGLIPGSRHPHLLAAFNGGFRAMHGNYGMMVGGRTFVAPRDIACTIAFFPEDRLQIRTWSKISSQEKEMVAYRQTPPCLVERGEPNPGLLSEFNRNWGATVGGDTIIRRSALGLSRDGRFLFYGLGDAVTAQSIGRAMQVVGAEDAAQLDVNYSYPRFVLFEQNAGGVPIASSPLLPDLKFSPTDYVAAPQQRDFFYLARKGEES